jgi:REP element-mobilizing transposase RayT
MGQPRRRNSLRLQGYDYSQVGAYHIVCTAAELGAVFGHPKGENVALNPIGQMVEEAWQQLPSHYSGVEVDIFKVMPDHFHGLVILVDPTVAGPDAEPRKLGLSDVVQRFKSLTTHRHRISTGKSHLWRRGYWDEIITSERQLDIVRRYIYYNALKDYLKGR